jgi:predicted Fe-Mo cluster-binding NifX family protein
MQPAVIHTFRMKEQNIEAVLAEGIGLKALDILSQNKITVVSGIQRSILNNAIEKYL